MPRASPHRERLRVLVNGIHAISGGGVTHLRNIMPLLAEDDELELHLVIHRHQADLFAVDARIAVHLQDFRNGFFARLAWEQLALPLLARRLGADVTFSPANFGPLLAPAPVIMLRNALAVGAEDRRLAKRLYWTSLAVMTALSLMRCRRAIAISDYARRAMGFGGWMRNKITVVHNGVSELFQPSEAPRAADRLLVVSDIYVQKNLHSLIEALAIVRRSRPGARLAVAGRAIDRDYAADVARRVERLGLGDAVEFLGACQADRLLALYRSCTLFVFPSTVETFGNPLVEAMACGAPIASSNTAAMPEILGNAAAYFDPSNASDMAARITELLGDEAKRARLSRNALLRARRYSWALTARKTADVIKSAAAPTRARKIAAYRDRVA